MANSRMKDFFDIVVLARTFDFDGDWLSRAIRATFDRRGTTLPAGLPVALTSEFAGDAAKQAQWKAFLRKSGAMSEAEPLPDVVSAISAFVVPPLRAAVVGGSWPSRWPRGGPWATA